jgi:hypothetical protein
LESWYRDGIPIWWDESDRISFDAMPRVSKSRAAIERAQEAESKKKKRIYGRYYVAEPRVIDGGEFPTMQEWLKEQEEKRGPVIDRRPSGPNIIQGKK